MNFTPSKKLLDLSNDYGSKLSNKRLIGIFLTALILFLPRLVNYNIFVSILAFFAIVPFWIYYFNWKSAESKKIKEIHEAEYEISRIIIEIDKIDKLKNSGLMSGEDYLQKKDEYQRMYDKYKGFIE
ncbi:hypothetical protein [Cohnella terricola]|uniref:Uncharacterized protein n=1 Tax=Cohnella terricola TaxID=1289167 RepID=A0A559JX64_9BACL|nr:hypothetical protein [Cohnella terricola]TVY04474.1 hypothetical protein FPZ45_02520 [Cohnella terricola]